MSFEVSWRKVRGELPGWCAGDAGMVPLSARETAKGEEQATQKCCLFFNAVTCALRGSQIPGSCTPVRTLTAGGGIAGIF